MLVEGRGLVTPVPIEIHLTDDELRFVRREAQERNAYRRYSSRRDAWGAGLTGDPVLKGMLGELAVVVWLNRKFGKSTATLDTTLRKHGDGGVDICVFGCKLEVKSETYQRDHVLIRRAGPKGDNGARLIPLASDYYVSACVADVKRPLLNGWIGRTALIECAKRGRGHPRSGHTNTEIPKNRLLPMSQLQAELKLAKEPECCRA